MMSLNTYKIYIFDFDGVLVDSNHIKAEAFAALFKEFGADVQKQVVAHHLLNGGITRFEKIRYYFKEFVEKELSDSHFKKVCNRFSELVVDKVVSAPEIAGAQEFVEKNIPVKTCCINSATPDGELYEIVKRRGLLKYFHNILGSDKSKSENLKYILETHGFSNAEALFFGDSLSDYHAALECNVDFFGVINNDRSPLYDIRHKFFHSTTFEQLLKAN